MNKLNLPKLSPKIVLGIAAHPDDLDFGAAGTMARFLADGATVHYLILTDGSQGSADRGVSPAQLASAREREQQAALEALGGDGRHVTFLGFRDGALEVTRAAKEAVVKEIRRVKPDVVVTMDPSLLYSAERGVINHPDHRAAGQIALDAVYPLARDHLAFPHLVDQGYEPHKVKTVLLTNFDHHNYVVDITDTIGKKQAALAAHASQVDDLEAVSQMIKHWSAVIGQSAGYAHAEAFMRIDVR